MSRFLAQLKKEPSMKYCITVLGGSFGVRCEVVREASVPASAPGSAVSFPLVNPLPVLRSVQDVEKLSRDELRRFAQHYDLPLCLIKDYLIFSLKIGERRRLLEARWQAVKSGLISPDSAISSIEELEALLGGSGVGSVVELKPLVVDGVSFGAGLPAGDNISLVRQESRSGGGAMPEPEKIDLPVSPVASGASVNGSGVSVAPRVRRGGKRGVIRVFTYRSWLRLKETSAKLPYLRLVEQGWKVHHIILTIQADLWLSRPDFRKLKSALHRFFSNDFKRAHEGDWMAIWVMEFTERGVPHFHLLVVSQEDRDFYIKQFKIDERWTKQLVRHFGWSEDDKRVKDMMRYSVRTRSARSFEEAVEVARYSAKYLSKLESKNEEHLRSSGQVEEFVSAFRGRFWGIYNRAVYNRLVSEERIEVSEKEFYIIRRLLRRLKEARRKAKEMRVGKKLRSAPRGAPAFLPRWELMRVSSRASEVVFDFLQQGVVRDVLRYLEMLRRWASEEGGVGQGRGIKSKVNKDSSTSPSSPPPPEPPPEPGGLPSDWVVLIDF